MATSLTMAAVACGVSVSFAACSDPMTLQKDTVERSRVAESLEPSDAELDAVVTTAAKSALTGSDRIHVQSVKRLREHRVQAVSALLRKLQTHEAQTDRKMRWSLVSTLGSLGDRDSVPTLEEEAKGVVRDASAAHDDVVPYAALTALTRLARHGDPEAHSAVVRLLHHEDVRVRSSTASAALSVDPEWARGLERELGDDEKHFFYRKPLYGSSEEGMSK